MTTPESRRPAGRAASLMPGAVPALSVATWMTKGLPPHLEDCLLSLVQKEDVRLALKEHLENEAIMGPRVEDRE